MKYFGVIGNRDYIKLRGVKLPFWEFLDEQPDGWLTSIVYHRDDLPLGRPMIFDCGAWSYKDADEPTVTPKDALEQYMKNAPGGSMLIAPDHMIIPGKDNQNRKQINRRNAAEFISICPVTHLQIGRAHV